MPEARAWTRDELLLAMNLYCTLPFGRLNHRTPEIVEMAQALDRTPSSVSMKLCNFASLDPALQARGVKGLTGASRADRAVWDEFHADWDGLAAESEEKREAAIAATSPNTEVARDRRRAPITMPITAHVGPDEGEVTARARYSQRFFRRSVLSAYGVRCCITSNPVPELLVASHILPWSTYPKHRTNPRNGLCLSRTHDAAFDQGLITLDEDHRLVLSRYLRDFLPNEAIRCGFLIYEGQQINLPEKFLPDAQFLEHHRTDVFQE